jgi:mannosyl-oligosaccharide alpha-1,2-mannosidase
MARRKIRLLIILAFIAVFLLFHFLRGGNREVFTFETLPPYTDNEHYVKKPIPQVIPGPEPPPPPPDWERTATGKHQFKQVDEPDYLLGDKVTRPERVPGAPRRKPGKQQDLQVPGRGTHVVIPPDEGALHKNPAAVVIPSVETSTVEGLELETSTAKAPMGLDQPPPAGDFHKQAQKWSYSAQDLVPRVQKYPIPANQLIQLPKMKPKRLPRVQARTTAESSDQKRVREQRQRTIKSAMTRSWEAYSRHAMGHDELRPVSGRTHDPFCGWGATLVDSLDTLLIMGMKTEYDEALKWIAEIDFAHTRSYSIPLFETVIRYLGGLIGAYDVSNGRDDILLEKARDLADMLMGAFDTLNHMPLLRYDWRPQASRQNLRAGSDICLAELGTLSMEFTRLAQLTGNHTYYDAVSPSGT